MKLINTVTFIIMIFMNVLANALPLGGKNTGELSDLYPNLFVPIGFTFSIWGAIYLLLLGFIVWQWLGNSKAVLDKIGYWFTINTLANSAWILAWHYQLVILSVCVMFVILISLIKIYTSLDIRYGALNLFYKPPISVYLGWISVATIANITAVLVNFGYTELGVSSVFWTTTMVTIAGLLGILMLWKRKDIFYAGVIMWAAFGIYSKRTLDTTSADGVIETAAIGVISILTLLIVIQSILFIKNGISHGKPLQ